MTAPCAPHNRDRVESPSPRPTATESDPAAVVRWPDPSPLQAWWEDIMRPARQPGLVA
ncbi:hypothetical protein [Nocardia blacklockiae]|uniref:hypothetical protein n=1 Tax=Nocardia blacklockiae TaxID=480036 RepID=UPI001894E531|nr:hypothetical protein [Nocardia blacklockiae]MBF6175818.1 hypothetical protein [Nocardia blacklockiae]